MIQKALTPLQVRREAEPDLQLAIRCRPASQAAKAGLEVGHRVLTVAGREPTGVMNFYMSLIENGLLAGKGVEIEYLPLPDEDTNTSPPPRKTSLKLSR